jgi:hypothetical protein
MTTWVQASDGSATWGEPDDDQDYVDDDYVERDYVWNAISWLVAEDGTTIWLAQ